MAEMHGVERAADVTMATGGVLLTLRSEAICITQGGSGLIGLSGVWGKRVCPACLSATLGRCPFRINLC